MYKTVIQLKYGRFLAKLAHIVPRNKLRVDLLGTYDMW